MAVRNFAALLCTTLSLQLALMPCAMANPGNTAPATSPASVTTSNNPSLDLSSTSKNMRATASGVIMIGNSARLIRPNDMITAAESLALSQVLGAGSQSINLARAGNATGGRFNIDASMSTILSSLVIPKGVQAVQTASLLNLSGNLTNLGSLYALSQTRSQPTAFIVADTILNQKGATISTILPNSIARSYKAISGLNLDLTAATGIINAGTISSAGSLSITTPNVTNSGVIEAVGGNISFDTSSPAAITINNAGGQIRALAGNINIRDASFTAKYDTIITGGDLIANQINIYSGDGTIESTVKGLTGTVNVWGGIAHVTASTAKLSLGQINLTGDPTFYNTLGDIFIRNDLSFPGQHLAIVASGDIIADGAQIINTSSPNLGGSLTLIAGAAFDTSGDPSAPPNGPPDRTSVITVHGGNQNGGKIDLATKPLAAISTVGGFNSGGNVTMVAYSGAKAGSGTVWLPDITLTTGSGGTDLNGNVQIFAGATSGVAIRTGNINAQGANNGTGNIFMLNANPLINGGSIQIVDGNMISGNFVADPNALPAGSASIAVGDVTSSGGAINLIAGGNITTGVISTIGKNPTSGTNGGVALRGFGNITTGNVSAQGGAINIIAGNVLTVGDITNDGANRNGINGGINLAAGATTGYAINAGNLFAGGNSQSSGNISLVTSTKSNCPNCAVINLPVDTQGGIKVGNITTKGQINLMAGGDVQAGILNSSGVGQFGGQVFILTNNNSATLNEFMVGGGGPNSVLSITVGAGSDGAGAIGITSGGGGGINVSNREALLFQLPVQGWGISLGLNAKNGTLTTSGQWNADGIVNGDGGRINLAGKTINFTDTVNISANGTGEGSGGSVSLTATNLALPSGQTVLNANGSGSMGMGGIITVSSTSSTTVGAGGLLASARGSGDGMGGTITLGSANGGTTLAGGAVTLDVSSDTTQSGSVTISNGGILNIGSATLTAKASSASGLAGAINVNTAGITTTSGSFLADASSVNGSAGTVAFWGGNITTGSGGITAHADAANGFGGNIDIAANSIATGSGGGMTMTANGGISGGFITASINATSGGANIALAANATGTTEGSGGVIALTSSGSSDIAIGAQAGRISLSATGYSTGANAGNGGTLRVSAGQNIIVDGSGLNVATTAANGNGGNITLTAGTATQGNIQATGTISADGTGTGNGGNIELVYSASGLLNSGGGVANFSARSIGSGRGGAISIANNMGAAPIGLVNNGTMNVESAGGNGSINLISAQQDAVVQGNGSFVGGLNITARNINVTAARVDVGKFNSTSSLNLTAPTINLASTSAITAGGGGTITTAAMVNNGSITATGGLGITSNGALAVSGSGTVKGAGISITSNAGAVQIAQGKFDGTVTGAAATSFSLTSGSADLSVGTLTANNGNLSIVQNGGNLTVMDGSTLTAKEGSVLVQNNTASGNITFRPNAAVIASSATAGNGQIYIVLGATPSAPIAGPKPANMTVTELNGGGVYFGSTGITSQCCNQTARADGANVVFDTNGASSSGIVLTSNNSLSATFTGNNGGGNNGGGNNGGGNNGGGNNGGGNNGGGNNGGGNNGGGNNGGGNNGGGIGQQLVPVIRDLISDIRNQDIRGIGQNIISIVRILQGLRRASIESDSNSDIADNEDEQQSEFKPVAYIQGAASFTAAHADEMTFVSAHTDTAFIKHTGRSRVLLNRDGILLLRKGEMLLATDKPTFVIAGSCGVHVPGSSIVHIAVEKDTVKVRSLRDAGSMQMIAGSHYFELNAGQEAVIAENSPAMDAMSADRVARRRVHQHDTTEGFSIATSEYSLVSLLDDSALLKQMFTRSESEDRPLVEKVMKTAVALSTITASHGTYSRINP